MYFRPSDASEERKKERGELNICNWFRETKSELGERYDTYIENEEVNGKRKREKERGRREKTKRINSQKDCITLSTAYSRIAE